ncbi:MAG TPA: winged helix-turn-helix domain-containing protein [Solirubrobacterales bacterium]
MTQDTRGGEDEPEASVSRRILLALAHPVRIRTLEALAGGDASATMLSREFELSLSNVSYHLCKVLFEECEMVTVIERHQRRGAEERVFRLTPEGHIALALIGFLATASAKLEGGGQSPEATCGWHAVAVDGKGREEITELMERLEEAVEAIAHRCANRRPEELQELLVGAAAFEAVPQPTKQGTDAD